MKDTFEPYVLKGTRTDLRRECDKIGSPIPIFVSETRIFSCFNPSRIGISLSETHN